MSMLLLCCPYVLKFITHIINCSIETSTFPSLWKLAYVTPLPKVSSPVEFKDLRPISILPALSKLYEKILYLQLKEHLNKYNILPSVQSGFRAGHGCETALLSIVDDYFSST